MKPGYYKLSEVSKMTRLTPDTLRRYIKSGKLKALKSGNKFYVHVDHYREFQLKRVLESKGIEGEIANKFIKFLKQEEAEEAKKALQSSEEYQRYLKLLKDLEGGNKQ